MNVGFRTQVKGDVAIASNPFKVSTQKAGQDILLLHHGESEEIPGILDVLARRQDDVAFDSARRHACSKDKQQRQDRQTKTSILIA